MICSACGKANDDKSAFCEQCGTKLQAQPAAVPGPVAPGSGVQGAATQGPGFPGPAVPPPPPGAFIPPPTAPVAPGAGAILAAMSMGEKVSGAGAIAGLVGFFLPWRTAAAGATGAAAASMSGLDLAKTLGSVYMIPLASIVAAVLVYSSSKAPAGKRLMYAGFLMLLGAFGGPGDLTALLFVSSVQSTAGFGMWLSSLGLCAVIGGGLMTILDFSKRTY